MSSRCVTPTRRRVPMEPYSGDTSDGPPTKTPRATPFTASRTDGETNTCYFAFIENNCREVGAALLTLYPPSLSLFQYSDTALYSNTNSFLEVHHPTKVILPNNIKKSSLSQVLISKCPQNVIVEVPRGRFSDQMGTSMINELKNSSSDLFDLSQLSNRYLCLSAASACLQYVRSEVGYEMNERCLSVAFKSLDGHLMVDPIVLTSFGILTNRSQSKQYRISTQKRKSAEPTLFNLLDRCYTPSGARFLRSTLASPPSESETIILRLDFVDEVRSNAKLHKSLCEIFQSIADIDPVITYFVSKGNNRIVGPSIPLDCLLRLNKNYKLINRLMKKLGKMKSSLAIKLTETISESKFDQIGAILSHFLEDSIDIDAASYSKDNKDIQVHAIKPNCLAILDITRKSYDESLADMVAYTKNLSDKYHIPISLAFNKTRRFHLVLSKGDLNKPENNIMTSLTDPNHQFTRMQSSYLIPGELVHVVEQTSNITATTLELLLLNKKNETAQNDSISISHQFIVTKIEEIRPFISSIYTISETIGLLDMLISFASVSNEFDGYSKPELINYRCYSYQKGRHPIMERVFKSNIVDSTNSLIHQSNQKKEFVPNSCDFTQAKPMIILCGINMSGKSTYIQTVAILALMAQSGSFVPTDHLSLYPFQSLFARSGTFDSLEGNASAFYVEMKEMAHITSRSDENSLIIIDEPCISTSVRDGIGLAFSCLEQFLVSHSFTICATHYKELDLLNALYPSVQINQMAVTTNGKKFNFQYTAVPGSVESQLYGNIIARDYLPPELIEIAEKCFNKIQQNKKPVSSRTQTGCQATAIITQKLLSLQESQLEDEELRTCLLSLQRKCSFGKNY